MRQSAARDLAGLDARRADVDALLVAAGARRRRAPSGCSGSTGGWSGDGSATPTCRSRGPSRRYRTRQPCRTPRSVLGGPTTATRVTRQPDQDTGRRGYRQNVLVVRGLHRPRGVIRRVPGTAGCRTPTRLARTLARVGHMRGGVGMSARRLDAPALRRLGTHRRRPPHHSHRRDQPTQRLPRRRRRHRHEHAVHHACGVRLRGPARGPGPSDVARLAAAMADGALRGARGNSGVILSQILRGSPTSPPPRPKNVTACWPTSTARCSAPRCGTRSRWSVASMGEAVPGTIVSVLQAAAAAAEEAAADRDEVAEVVAAGADAAASRWTDPRATRRVGRGGRGGRGRAGPAGPARRADRHVDRARAAPACLPDRRRRRREPVGVTAAARRRSSR